MANWLGVVCRDHVERGVERGVAQLNHGNRGPLARMQIGDRLIYYSPRTSLRGGEPLQAFTAIGQIADDEIWQADEGDFRPWRRRVAYRHDVRAVLLQDVRAELELTRRPNWGYELRRGLIELGDHDIAALSTAMSTMADDGDPPTTRRSRP